MADIHIMKYFPVIKRNKLLIHTAQMDFITFHLSEKSQAQKTAYGIISFISSVQNRQIYRDKMQISGKQINCCLGSELRVQLQTGSRKLSGAMKYSKTDCTAL